MPFRQALTCVIPFYLFDQCARIRFVSAALKWPNTIFQAARREPSDPREMAREMGEEMGEMKT